MFWREACERMASLLLPILRLITPVGVLPVASFLSSLFSAVVHGLPLFRVDLAMSSTVPGDAAEPFFGGSVSPMHLT